MGTDQILVQPKRDYVRLLGAMSNVMRALREEAPQEEVLRRSFRKAVEGFCSHRALLLLVDDEGEPPVLRRLEARGLTDAQVRACEMGESVKGVSSKLIRNVIRERRLRIIQNPFFLSPADRTYSLQGEQGELYSALCAPILDPSGTRIRAVVYLSNVGPDPAEAYGEADGEVLEEYTAALAHVFSVYFDKEKREDELRVLRARVGADVPELVGESAETQKLRRLLHEVYIPMAGTRDPEPLLILGETGTGKDLLARYIHAYGARSSRPFVVVNCAEVTDDLAGVLFSGHMKGAFTGADRPAPGLFRAAHEGVLFLDEVGELSPRAQGALLRAIDNREVMPLGATSAHRVNVFVVLATNRDLDQAVRDGALKDDLYRRFKTHQIRLKPLRERPWDVAPLVSHFLRHHERRAGKKLLGLSEDTRRALLAYPWPGNVREVSKVCALLVAHAKVNQRIDRAALLALYPDLERAASGSMDACLLANVRFREATVRYQRELVLSRLEAFEHNVRAARESLGLPKSTFRRKLKQLGLHNDVVVDTDES